MRVHRCRICGYDGLEQPQYSENDIPNYNSICSCCGFQAGYDDLDLGFTFEEYRRRWLQLGCQWFDLGKKPDGWDAQKQLLNLKDRGEAKP